MWIPPQPWRYAKQTYLLFIGWNTQKEGGVNNLLIFNKQFAHQKFFLSVRFVADSFSLPHIRCLFTTLYSSMARTRIMTLKQMPIRVGIERDSYKSFGSVQNADFFERFFCRRRRFGKAWAVSKVSSSMLLLIDSDETGISSKTSTGADFKVASRVFVHLRDVIRFARNLHRISDKSRWVERKKHAPNTHDPWLSVSMRCDHGQVTNRWISVKHFHYCRVITAASANHSLGNKLKQNEKS